MPEKKLLKGNNKLQGYLENANPQERPAQAPKAPPRSRRKNSASRGPATGLKEPDDPRVFGRQLTFKEMVGLGFKEMAALRRRELPLDRKLTAEDFTARGRLAILRWRGYDDAEIAALYPTLLQEAL